METIEVTTPETDSLAVFREQVKAEQANKTGMSEAAASKLRALNEFERLDKIDTGRFCTALKSVMVNDENLGKLIQRCHTSTPVTDIERRVHKLNYFIQAGFELGREIDSVHLINFFSELTSDEAYMSDSSFAAQWTAKDAARTKQYRLDHGIIKQDSTEPVYRPCKSGKKCMKYEKRKPAPAAGKGAYCSIACAASDRARQKRALAAMATGTIQ
jgi:hypothetical protein